MDYLGDKNLYNKIDLIPGMERGQMFGPGRYIDTEDQQLHKFTGIETDIPWIFVNTNPDLYCMDYRGIFDGFNFIPSKCLNCYKIVVMPQSFHQLMQLMDLMGNLARENPKCWCKCGIERRDFVPRSYGGYFYTRGLEQGRVRYKTVRRAVSEHISPDVNVILKRYCTEFEMLLGPSDKYVQPERAKGIERQIWCNVHLEKSARPQPDFVKMHIIKQWMLFAWGRGDMTVKQYNNNQPLYPGYVTYHDEE